MKPFSDADSVNSMHHFILLFFFIYKLRQEAWIAHRASSTTRFRKKERKLVIQLKRMTILSKQETEMQKQNWEGHR